MDLTANVSSFAPFDCGKSARDAVQAWARDFRFALTTMSSGLDDGRMSQEYGRPAPDV